MTNHKENIHIIVTGGTIDSKFHAPKEGSLVKEHSGIPQFLNETIVPHFTFTFDQFVMLDSSDITDQIRDELIVKINNCNFDKILITHGTNTMTETLKYLSAKLEGTEKTIFLTGAMIPLDGFCPTDSGFNLGYAIAQLQNHSKGFYISMNGAVFKTNEVEKNFKISRFEFIENS